MRPAGALRAAVVLCLGLATALPAPATQAQGTGQPAPDSELENVERQLELKRQRAEELARERAALNDEIAGLRQQAITAAREAQNLESELDAIEYTLAALRAEEARLGHGLDQQRQTLTETLAALQRVALLPPESLLGQPGEPLDLARGALLLGVAVPEIERQAARLRHDLETLAELHDQIDGQRRDLGQAASRLAGEREKLDGLVARKQTLESAAGADQQALERQVSSLAGEAQSLRDLIVRLEEDRKRRQEQARRVREAAEQAAAAAEARARAEAAERAAAQPAPGAAPGAQPGAQPPAEAPVEAPPQVAALPAPPAAELSRPAGLRGFQRGADVLVMPLRGRVARRFGEPAEGSWESAQGLSLAARAGSTVVAPYDGRVAYAGPFRGYGLILIIEHGDEYHSLVAGFDRLTAVVGQWVLAGEPVGTLRTGAEPDQRLYLELRRNGVPVDPLPLLATGDDKARG
ncbi:MAG: peptidoglycan DD-metalloendopeptidase family protein [Tistlia sp.]|uniref:murein hydrolase activator EnvC n=1 Tax=Tistlia sp. TaxID=3057121 RepID=UPI0034A1ACDC